MMDNGCRVYLVRHGETVWNKDRRFQGHTDIALSERGMEQARALSLRLSKQKIAAVYASDLQRALQTAEVLARPHALPVQACPELRELHFGHWEGLTFHEMQEGYPAELKAWWNSPLDTAVPGSQETLRSMAGRVSGIVSQLVKRHLGNSILVVCHGGPVRALVAEALQMDLNQHWRLRQDNAALNILEYYPPDKAILTLFNDRSHLPEELL
ncbi:MAG: alpha-ribazole phosphatase [Desulfurispora sp.]|uniref:alpha-ribazole phosphatase n=1 Tax=Desulfurispora sp. TaxID=3014275 RepID=UPI00404AB971